MVVTIDDDDGSTLKKKATCCSACSGLWDLVDDGSLEFSVGGGGAHMDGGGARWSAAASATEKKKILRLASKSYSAVGVSTEERRRLVGSWVGEVTAACSAASEMTVGFVRDDGGCWALSVVSRRRRDDG